MIMLCSQCTFLKAVLTSESQHWCSLKQELIHNQGNSSRAFIKSSTLLRGGMSQKSTAEARHLYLCTRNQDYFQILILDAITEKIIFFRPSILSFIPPETENNAWFFSTNQDLILIFPSVFLIKENCLLAT